MPEFIVHARHIIEFTFTVRSRDEETVREKGQDRLNKIPKPIIPKELFYLKDIKVHNTNYEVEDWEEQ